MAAEWGRLVLATVATMVATSIHGEWEKWSNLRLNVSQIKAEEGGENAGINGG